MMLFNNKTLLASMARHALVAIASIIAASVAVFSLSQGINRAANAAANSKQETANLRHQVDLFSILSRDSEIIDTNDKLIESAFLSSDNILNFVTTLESLGQKNSFEQKPHFATPTPSDVPTPTPLSMILYGNSFSTNITTLTSYLRDFEDLPYFTKINGINFTTSNDLGWRGGGMVTINATLYTKVAQ